MKGRLVSRPSCCPGLQGSASRRAAVTKCCFMAASRSLPLTGKCPYRTLGIRTDADEETIKSAFRRKVKQTHPDHCKEPFAGLAFMECQNAYKILLDPELRAKYDKTLLPSATRQALSYLNSCSAARHGLSSSSHRRSCDDDDRPELYSTIKDLLAQVKCCAEHLERVYGKDGVRRRVGIPNPAVTAARVDLTAAEFCSDETCDVECQDSECCDAECCVPWMYFAAQVLAEEEKTQARRGRY